MSAFVWLDSLQLIRDHYCEEVDLAHLPLRP